MAQLYKMTLYVCDLEDNLSLGGIETLIEQNAFNGIFANCICHFADSQIGQNVGWDDAIDLTRCGCPTSAWDKYFAPPTKEKTYADRIRAMNDEELADFLAYTWATSARAWQKDTIETLHWLQQPAEEDNDDNHQSSNGIWVFRF